LSLRGGARATTKQSYRGNPKIVVLTMRLLRQPRPSRGARLPRNDTKNSLGHYTPNGYFLSLVSIYLLIFRLLLRFSHCHFNFFHLFFNYILIQTVRLSRNFSPIISLVDYGLIQFYLLCHNALSCPHKFV